VGDEKRGVFSADWIKVLGGTRETTSTEKRLDGKKRVWNGSEKGHDTKRVWEGLSFKGRGFLPVESSEQRGISLRLLQVKNRL